jgi:hypothetical protein
LVLGCEIFVLTVLTVLTVIQKVSIERSYIGTFRETLRTLRTLRTPTKVHRDGVNADGEMGGY